MNPFKKYRESVGLKQTEVAEKLGLVQTTISMWESGDIYPRAELLPKIAILYGCTTDTSNRQKKRNTKQKQGFQASKYPKV